MNKILKSAAVIAFVAAVAVAGTSAWFSDTETSTGNTFAAGAIDLKIDNESYVTDVNGDLVYSGETSWALEDLTGQLFFQFNDLKPGDIGEDTISLHVDSNDAWACMAINVTATPENGQTEPELDVDTTLGTNDGELQNELKFVFWNDDGDNVYEIGELAFWQNQTIAQISEAGTIALADSSGQGVLGATPLLGNTERYIGKAWCFGDMTLTPVAQDLSGKTGTNGPLNRGTGIACSGASATNITQTDGIVADVEFYAVQSRNNADFVCTPSEDLDDCFDQADVMMVLDRSGSIDGGEMTSLKNAANAFVDAMNPNGGVHMGQTSFATTGSLDRELTGDKAAIKAAINGLTSGGGWTNLYEGIFLADQELESSRDRLDSTTPDYMLVITDGRPNQPTNESTARIMAAGAAATAKSKGVTIYAVGVGSDVDSDYLRNSIASSSAHYFGIGAYDNLEAILQAIAGCETPGLPPVPEIVSLNPDYGYDTTSGSSSQTLNATQLGYMATSNDVRYRSYSDWKWTGYPANDEYIKFQFPDIPTGATVNSVALKFEWQRNLHITAAQMKIWDGSSWQIYTLDLPTADTDSTVTLNLKDLYGINTSTKVNALEIWFQARGTSSQVNEYTYHDWVQVDVTYTP